MAREILDISDCIELSEFDINMNNDYDQQQDSDQIK
jgi:hypothetical protein